jgi:hypothetical protein
MSRKQFQWNQLNPEHLLDPSESRVDSRAIFRLHWGVDLQEEDDSHIKEMMQHVKDLRSKAVRYGYETAADALNILSKHFMFLSLNPFSILLKALVCSAVRYIFLGI